MDKRVPRETEPKPPKRPFEKPVLKKEGRLTRVVNLTGYLTVAGGRE